MALLTKIDTDLTLSNSSLYFYDEVSGETISAYTYNNGSVILAARENDNTISVESYSQSMPITAQWIQNLRLNFQIPPIGQLACGDIKIKCSPGSKDWIWKYTSENGAVMDIRYDFSAKTLTTKRRTDDISMAWSEWMTYLQLLEMIKRQVS